MKKLIPVLGIAVLWPPAAAWAQLAAPNEAGVALGHFHTIVRDVAATKNFWTIVGGTAIKIDGTDVLKFPGVFIFLTPGSPSGGSYGSVINHIPFLVPNLEEAITKWKAAGATVEMAERAYARTPLGWAYTPDDLKIRITPDKAAAPPIASPGIQMWAPADSVPEVQAWYIKMFGATGGQKINNGLAINGIPGLRIAATAAGAAPESRTPKGVGLIHGAPPDPAFMDRLAQTNLSLPTKGRTLDHIGFEVTNLEAFCKKLEASGVKFEEPYSKSRRQDFASAKLTDPWGTTIELTEGLRQF